MTSSDEDNNLNQKTDSTGNSTPTWFKLTVNAINEARKQQTQHTQHTQHTQNTQPATQPLSPGNLRHSGLTPADLIDVFCILHPTSAAAFNAVQLTAAAHPGNVLRDQLTAAETAIDGTRNDNEDGDNSASGNATPGASGTDDNSLKSPVGIALRISQFDSLLKPSRGWVFGRNPRLADVCIAKFEGAGEMEKKISNQHYRIHVNGHGIVMLDDTSTNGTIVEGELVSSRRKNGASPSRMLTQGCTIQLLMDATNPINFVVWYPTRPADAQHQFEKRFRDWVVRAVRAGLIEPPESDCSIENTLIHPMQQRSPSYDLQRWEKQDRGAVGAVNLISIPSANHTFGMNWNGAPNYSVVGMIGKGAFATVYKIATKKDGRIYACKELDRRSLVRGKKAQKMISQELQIMDRLYHPHIVEFHSSYIPPLDNRYLYIVMEYVRHGELASYLSEHPDGRLPESEVRIIAFQVIHAIQYLHAENVTHRDIKPENILIASWDPLRVKLSDFGLSKIANAVTGGAEDHSNDRDDIIGVKGKAANAIGGTFLKTFCGTLLYCAPEVYPGFDKYRKRRDFLEARDETVMPVNQLTNWYFKRKKRPKPRTYNQTVDIWSYAAVIFHLLTGKPPFMPTSSDKHGAAMLQKIMTTEPNWKSVDEAGVSDQAKQFLRSVMQRFPEDRPDEWDILWLEWLRHMREEVDYQNFLDDADFAKIERGEGPKVDSSFNELDEDGNIIDHDMKFQQLEAEVRRVEAIARSRGCTKAGLLAWEKDVELNEMAEQEEEEDEEETPESDYKRRKVEQKKQDLSKPPSNGSFSDEEVNRIMGGATSTTPTSVTRQLFTTPAKATKRQRAADGEESFTPTNPAKRQRTTEDGNSVTTKQTFAGKERADQKNLPRTPPNQIVYLFPENAKTLTPRHSEGRQPYVSIENEQDEAEPTPAKSDHTPQKNDDAVGSGHAPLGVSSRVAQPELQEKKTATPTRPITDPFARLTDKTGPATPSTMRTRHFELADSEKDWGASGSITTEDERDAPVHSFGLSVEITASFGLKHWDADRGARAIIDERNVFANGVKIAGKGGSPTTVGTTVSPRKRRSSAGDLRDTDVSRSSKVQERDRPRSSGPGSVAVQSGSPNGSMARRDVSQRKPPSVRLAEIDPNETEHGHQNDKQTDHPTGSSHPDPFQKPVAKVPTKSLPPPHAELGKLIPVQGSFYPRSIPLHDRLTSWGRGLNTSIRYPDLYDYRIPKYALEIAFWAPGIESMIENGTNWKTVPRICTVLGTKASGSIYVNGVELRKENKAGDARCFGKIYSGDIITIYKDKKCFLAFRCVFFHGEGRMKRPVKERPFKVLEARYPGGVDPDKRDCRGGTAVSGTTIQGAGIATGTSTRRGTPISRRASSASDAESATGGAGGNCVPKAMTSIN